MVSNTPKLHKCTAESFIQPQMRKHMLGCLARPNKWHIIQSIVSSWGRDHSSSSSPRGTGSWPGGKSWGSEMLTQLLWRPLRGAPSRALYPSTACRSMKWQTGAGFQGAETQCLPTNSPLPSLGRRAGLETYRLERVGPDLGLTSAQRPEGRGGCVSSHPGHPGLPSTRTASWGNPDGFREMGGPAQVCKQEQHVLFSVPAHPSEVSTPQLLWQQQGWAMAWMTSIY